MVPESGTLLAASGAVGRNAYDDETVALDLLDLLKVAYPALLEERYRFGLDAAALAQAHADGLMETIGRQRGALVAGGRVNLTKAAELVIADFRQGHMGCITLETPEQFGRWLAAGQRADAERQQARGDRLARPKAKPARRR